MSVTMFHLNVGGVRYSVHRDVLIQAPYFAVKDRPDFYVKDELGFWFIDRCGKQFKSILEFLKTHKVPDCLSSTDVELLKLEADYYGLRPLLDELRVYKPKTKEEVKSKPSGLKWSGGGVASGMIFRSAKLERDLGMAVRLFCAKLKNLRLKLELHGRAMDEFM